MRAAYLVVIGVIAGCDSGPDYDNTTPYPGPCSSHMIDSDGTSYDSDFEYEDARLTHIKMVHVVAGRPMDAIENTRRYDANGDLMEMRIAFGPDDPYPFVWTF